MSFSLAIDRGNTASKIYIFERNNLIKSFRTDKVEIAYLKSIFQQYDIKCVIKSSVQNEDRVLDQWLNNNTAKFIELTNLTPIPMKINYDNPELLGHDRIASAIGAMGLIPDENILVIDAGTAVTLDVVSAQGVFLGGNISPGLSIRFKALNQHTDKLPLITAEGEIPDIGHDTITAIRAGVVLGLAAEIDGYINRVKKLMNGDLKVIITGGDAHLLASKTDENIIEDETLLANGLNRILLYNK